MKMQNAVWLQIFLILQNDVLNHAGKKHIHPERKVNDCTRWMKTLLFSSETGHFKHVSSSPSEKNPYIDPITISEVNVASAAQSCWLLTSEMTLTSGHSARLSHIVQGKCFIFQAPKP